MSGGGSAHHRSSSTFLDEYSGVTALYSYLMQSWKLSPPFLRRNLPGNREAYKAEMAELNAAKRAAQKADKKGKGKSQAAASPSTRGGGSAGVSQSRRGVDDDAPTRKTHSSRSQVIYRLRYNGGLQECVKKKDNFQCIWCEACCNNIEDLELHLTLTHDRLDYTVVNGSTPEIYVGIARRSQRVRLQEDFTYVSKAKGGPHDTRTGMCPPESPASTEAEDEDEAEEEEEDVQEEAGISEEELVEVALKKRKAPDGKAKQEPDGKAAVRRKLGGSTKGKDKATKGFKDREYYRSQTCLKIDSDDMDYDSDDDVDDEWQIQRAEELMDEFVDVTEKEKAFMKLWNRFIHKHAILADFQVPDACVVFARHHAGQLVGEDLRDELLLHMFALWDFNLINKEQILEAVAIVDSFWKETYGPGAPHEGQQPRGQSSRGQSSKD